MLIIIVVIQNTYFRYVLTSANLFNYFVQIMYIFIEEFLYDELTLAYTCIIMQV